MNYTLVKLQSISMMNTDYQNKCTDIFA